MKKRNIRGLEISRGFLIFAAVCILLLSLSCSGGKGQSEVPSPGTETVESAELPDGPVTRATCLECHPAMAGNGFDIDSDKVKEKGMIPIFGPEAKKGSKR